MRHFLILLVLLLALAIPGEALATPAVIAVVGASAESKVLARRIARAVQTPTRATRARKATVRRAPRKRTKARRWPRGRWGYLNGVWGYWPYHHGYYPYHPGHPYWGDYRYGWGPHGPPPNNWDAARVNTPAPPNFMGDLYVWSSVAPMYAYPSTRSQVLARLPRRSVITNMGRYYSFYKVEAPNGQTGYVYAGAVGPQPF